MFSVHTGSLGAAIVAALIESKQVELGGKAARFFSSCSEKAPPETERYFENAAKKLLAEDYLSPSIGAGLFPDFLQRFLPIRIDVFDRARALERSIEQSWHKFFPSRINPFARNFREHWSPSGGVPMLLLNTTEVSTGVQAVIGPIESVSRIHTFFGRFGTIGSTRYDIPMSTAVVLSARFTALGPAGYHVDSDYFAPGEKRWALPWHTSPLRLVDGGYVENSGVETALSVARAIDYLIKYRQPELTDPRSPHGSVPNIRVRIQLLVIGSGGSTYSPTGLNELSSPVAAMYNARVQRSEIAIRDALEFDPNIRPVRIGWNFFRPPLGWYMSQYTIETLGGHIGTAERCISPGAPPSDEGPFGEHSYIRRLNEINSKDGGLRYGRIDLLFKMESMLHQKHCTACSFIRSAQGHTQQPLYSAQADVLQRWGVTWDDQSTAGTLIAQGDTHACASVCPRRH
jgi:hypothetical protein